MLILGLGRKNAPSDEVSPRQGRSHRGTQGEGEILESGKILARNFEMSKLERFVDKNTMKLLNAPGFCTRCNIF